VSETVTVKKARKEDGSGGFQMWSAVVVIDFLYCIPDRSTILARDRSNTTVQQTTADHVLD
jgi:hypothetical protein